MAIPFLSDISGKSATLAGTLSIGGGDSSTAQVALKGQQSLLSFVRGTSGDAQFFMSSDSERLYFSHTDIQSTNLILTLNQDKSATFAGTVSGTEGNFSNSVEAGALLKFGTNGNADIVNIGTGAIRFKPSSQTLALTLAGANATFAGKIHLNDESNPDGGGGSGEGGSLTVEGRRNGTANLISLRARDASDPTVALPDGQGGLIRWQGFDGTDFAQMGAIAVVAHGQAVANSDAPSKMIFYTTPDGSDALTTALTLDKSQNATFEGDVTITHANTPKILLKDTTNDLQARFRVANTYAYLSVDNPDAVSGSRLVFQVDGSEVLYLNSSLDANFAGNVNIATGSATSSGKLTIQAQGADGSDKTALVLRNYSASPFTGRVTTEYEVGTVNIAEVSAVRIDSNNGQLRFKTKQSGTIADVLTLKQDAGATFSGNITAIASSSHSFLTGNTSNLSTADTTGFRLHQSSYTDGRYTHRFRKKDMSGGVPLYLDYSMGTANVFANLMRFGAYSGESIDVEVNGKLKATHFYGDGSNLTGVTVSNADTVDNLHAASFLRSDAADTATGQLFFDAGFDSHPIMLSGAQNFDNIDRSGFYNLYNTNTNSTNSPGFDYGTMIAIGSDKAAATFGLQIAHERTGTGMYVRGMNDTASAWSAWAEIWTSTTDGSGSGLDADFLDGVQGSQFLRSDADDTATGIISVTKKLHDYDTIPANQNLLDIDSIKIAGRNDIYGNATKTVISDYVAKYENDNTGGTTIRLYVDDNILVDGDTYMVSVYYENLIGELSIDFADTAVTGNGTQTGTSSAPKSGRIYGYASRADYTSTYRFVDINLSQGSGHEVTLHSPKVEAGTTLTDFVATERTDMPTNSMHVKDLIATGGLQVIGPASHNFIQSENDYTLGFNDSTGTSQWWIKAYTNGNFAIHENGVGDKFTIAAGGNASFNGTINSGAITSTGNVSALSGIINPNYDNSNKYFIIGHRQDKDGGIVLRSEPTGGSGQNDWQILNHSTTGDLRFYAYGLGGFALTLDREDGNATFASNVLAGGRLETHTGTSDSALINSNSVGSSSTTTTVISVLGSSYTAAFFDYLIKNGTNVRAGTVTAVHDGTNVEFNETSTVDLGDTSDVTLSVDLVSSNFRLKATTTSNSWTIKSFVRAI